MSKHEKLLNRLLAYPKDFTWDELVKLLGYFDYVQVKIGKTAGSRVRFVNENHPPILLHRPHPTPILKRYQLENIINLLKQENLL